jgi:putative acetyltransferase
MRTAHQHLRKGVAKEMCMFLIAEAKRRDYKRLSIETGTADKWAGARALYASLGFHICPPFADYEEDERNVFMTAVL